MLKRGWFIFIILILAAVLFACSVQGEREIIPLATQTPTSATASQTPPAESATPVPATPRPQISATPSPTSLPSPTPTATVCLEGASLLPVPTRASPLEVFWLSDGDLWTWSEGSGEAWQVSEMGDVVTFSPSPDHSIIAVKRTKDLYQSTAPYREELWAVKRDGSNPHILLDAEQIASFGSVRHEAYAGNNVIITDWSEDQEELMISVIPLIYAIGGAPAPFGYWSVNVESGEVTRQAAPRLRHAAETSPDGLYYYVVGDESLMICRTPAHPKGSGCREQVIRYPRGPYEGEAWWYGYTIAWSPDSKLLSAVFPSEDYQWASNTGKLVAYEIPVAGEGEIKTAVFEAAPFLSYLSPDQKYLLFWRPVEPGSNTWELHVARFDGSADEVYASGEGLEISGWAPDSFHFVYWLKGAYMGSLCGGSVPLADVLDVRLVEWVDAERFIFVSGYQADGEGELRLGQTGGASTLLGPFAGQGAYYTIGD